MTIEKIVKETEKAVLVQVEVENCTGRKPVSFWFPKSQITIEEANLFAPDWLIRAKLEERFGQHLADSMWIN